ncbi:hypothetical protein F3Y22_tig00110210pilonHSYRG00105 [Hibiscus syriacus]|uniref:Uncharacterized protein n=1 Tax=Hibiscus syriacus TaxID=106335 RepID=A0A6A3B8S0_HIBSY|nr:hypothetical protein F3Y22_tig00110210pilonHSYRG00105 [Hibiscus syriacus]
MCVHPVRYFVIMSMQRSGSVWFETLLNSHINVSSNGEIMGTFGKEKECIFNPGILIKFITLTGSDDEDCCRVFQEKWGFYNILFRKNVLRRLVSLLANARDKEAKLLNGTHKSHVPHLRSYPKETAKAIEYFNTTRHIVLYYEDLVKNCSKLREVQDFLRLPYRELRMVKLRYISEKETAKAIEYFNTTRHIVLYYEDLVKNCSKLREVQDFLRLPYRELRSGQVKIHMSPLSEQVANWDGVLKADLPHQKNFLGICSGDFDGTGHFGMWQSEVLMPYFSRSRHCYEGEKPDDVEEKEWKRINRMACGTIRSCLSREQKSGSDVDGITSDEFEYLETTLLHGKVDVSLSEVTAALYSYELRKKDKENTSVEAEALVVRGRSKRHWKKECPRLKNKGKPERGKAVSESMWSSMMMEIQISHSLLRHQPAVPVHGFKRFRSGAKDGIMEIISLCTGDNEGNPKRNNVYYFLGSTIVGTAAVAASTDEQESEATRLWHMRLGHVGEKSLKLLIDQGLKGARACKLAFYVWGLPRQLHWEEHTIMSPLLMIFPRVWVKIKRLRTDNGGEYKNDPFLKVCEEEGIVRHLSEAKNFGLRLWSMLVTLSTAYHRLLWCKTPLEKWFGVPATDYDSLQCLVPMHTTMLRSQSWIQAKNAIFMGITSGVKSYRDFKKWSRQMELPKRWSLKEANFPTSKENDVDSPMVEEESDEEEVQTQELHSNMNQLHSERERGPLDNLLVMLIWSLLHHQLQLMTLVAKGYAQTEGVDYNEVFSPFVKHSSIRILLALVAQLDLELVQMDVKTAFLHGDLDEEIYMTQPDGFKVAEKKRCFQESDRNFETKTQLNREFEMKDLGEAKKILGMEISRDKKLGRLCLSQKEYLRKVPYASAVGSLMYAMVCTRPDISQAVGVVSRYMHDPGKEHWQAVKWILRYILNTVDVGLVFQQDKQDGQCVVGYCDSDYAEVEYMAVTEAVKEAIWLQGLLGELGMEQKHIKVHCDSQSAIHLAKNQVYHARTKHIDVRYHFVREILEEGGVIIQKIRTTENPADIDKSGNCGQV